MKSKVDLTKASRADIRAIRDQLDRIEQMLVRIEAVQRFQIESRPIAFPPTEPYEEEDHAAHERPAGKFQ